MTFDISRVIPQKYQAVDPQGLEVVSATSRLFRALGKLQSSARNGLVWRARRRRGAARAGLVSEKLVYFIGDGFIVPFGDFL